MDILVIDDEQFICMGLETILGKKGHSVDRAMNFNEAINRIEKKKYHIALVDLMLPKVQGNDIIKILAEKYPETAAILMTGYSTLDVSIEALKSGAFDFIPKPFTNKELMISVERASKRIGLAPEVIKELASRRSPDYYYLGENSWVNISDPHKAIIGMDPLFEKIAGKIVRIDLPEKEKEIIQGISFGQIIDEDNKSYKLLSPLTGRVVERNEVLMEATVSGRNLPLEGWLLKAIPSNPDKELEKLKRI